MPGSTAIRQQWRCCRRKRSGAAVLNGFAGRRWLRRIWSAFIFERTTLESRSGAQLFLWHKRYDFVRGPALPPFRCLKNGLDVEAVLRGEILADTPDFIDYGVPRHEAILPSVLPVCADAMAMCAASVAELTQWLSETSKLTEQRCLNGPLSFSTGVQIRHKQTGGNSLAIMWRSNCYSR